MPPNDVVDLTLDSDEEKSDSPLPEITSRRYKFVDELTPIRIDFTSRRPANPSASQKQPVASGSKPVAPGRPIPSGSGSFASSSKPSRQPQAPSASQAVSGSRSFTSASGIPGPLHVPEIPRRTKLSGPGPLSQAHKYDKGIGDNLKRPAPDARSGPVKRRKKSSAIETITIADSDSDEITTPTPRGSISSNRNKGKARASITPQARHRSRPLATPATNPVIESSSIVIDDDDMEIEEILAPDAPKTEPLDLTNISVSIEADVSDDESSNDEISDQDENGGYTYALHGDMWKDLPPRRTFTPKSEATANPAPLHRYRSPLRLPDEDSDQDDNAYVDGDSDEDAFEALAQQMRKDFRRHIRPSPALLQRQWGLPHGTLRGHHWSHVRDKFDFNVRERDSDRTLAASGSVLSIAQASGYVAVGSTTFRGSILDDGPSTDERDDGGFANSLGCLRVWDGVNQYPLDGHHTEWSYWLAAGHQAYRHRHFEVKEVIFDCSDPDYPYLLSAGGDGVVQVWHRPHPDGDVVMADADGQAVKEPPRELKLVANREADGLRAWHARACPTTLRLRSHHPDDRALAVGCSNGRIYIYNDYLDPNNWNHQASVPGYELCPAKSPRATGEVLWGRDTWLYASTESDAHGDHWAIDTSKRNGKGKERLCDGSGKPVTDSGDAMALTDGHDRLALFTRSKEAKHVLRVYDVKNTNFDAVTTVTLERFPRRNEIASEVTCAKFSPDGCFIAIGRNDNSFHMYDTRMWKEPIHRFQHNISANAQKNRSIGAPNYGVTHFEWVVPPRGGGLGFVSGGGDGCVYLWDMLNAHSARPELLAEMQHGVATFSVGDRWNGEKRLVVGDCGGQVRFFN